MLLALRNVRRRFFLASKENYFGGIKVGYVMVDTGCNTTLIPIPDGGLNDIVTLFSREEYKWTVTNGGGVAALQSPVLTIERIDGGQILVNLSSDFHRYDAKISSLRLHVSYDDAIALREIIDADMVYVYSRSRLDEFVTVVDEVRKSMPNVRIGERRTHALLGQSIIGGDNVALMQLGRLTVVCGMSERTKYTPDVVRELENSSMEHVRKSFASDGKEFDDLEDDDHDGDHDLDAGLYARDG